MPPEFELRPMQAEDLPDVERIERAGQPNPWSQGIFLDCLASGYRCDVATVEGRLVGFQVLSFVLDEAHLLNIGVDPAMRRRGLARAMLGRAMRDSAEAGAVNMFLEVRAGNSGAIALYDELGFCETCRRRDYYPGPNGREDALLMIAAL